MNEDRIDAALEAELERRAGRGDTGASHIALSPEERAELDALLEIADAVWEAGHLGAPPLEDDPTAIMLGLVPDPSISLSSKAITRYRKRGGLKPSRVATRLTERGWKVTTRDVFAWEERDTLGLSPALMRAIATALGVSEKDVCITRPASEPDAVANAMKADWFVDLTRRWADKMKVSPDVAKAAMRGRMVAVARRGGDLDEEQWRESLERLLSIKTGTAG